MVLEATINVASVPFQSLLPDLVPEHQHARAGAIMGLMHMAGYFVGLLAILVVRVVFADKTIVLLGDSKPGGYLLLLGAYLFFLLAAMLVTVLGTDEQRWAQAARKTHRRRGAQLLHHARRAGALRQDRADPAGLHPARLPASSTCAASRTSAGWPPAASRSTWATTPS